ncbi:uncharacterized protein EV420DRAFT_1588831 [Desarmillaria tabescens]|uniref:Uncharacterized protein n=1 Tax=Armillaria tabescens TaxID=1929756 RepID=A0AA39J9I0_ARMTA|nr:uncharacterized protein EV420DRAFT_1588831 [Desarmillaria tabescens]KAK0437274.1 hypothetical protein EV420DRAFT_1588831 [Desarmillaria tabescens]
MHEINKKVQRFEGWHYDSFAGVVPRRRVHGRDLGKTFSTPIVTFESIDSIPSSHLRDAHLLSPVSTAPSISIAAQDSTQHLLPYDVSFTSDGSSINDSTDLSSSSTAFSLPVVPTGVGLGILGLTRKDGGEHFDGLGLVQIGRSSGDSLSSSSDREISDTILREAALTFLQPSIPVACFEVDDNVGLEHPESEKTKPVDMPLATNRPRRSLTRNLSASTIASSLKRASRVGASSKVERGRSWR